jgi:hypothetical protein
MKDAPPDFEEMVATMDRLLRETSAGEVPTPRLMEALQSTTRRKNRIAPIGTRKAAKQFASHSADRDRVVRTRGATVRRRTAPAELAQQVNCVRSRSERGSHRPLVLVAG